MDHISCPRTFRGPQEGGQPEGAVRVKGTCVKQAEHKVGAFPMMTTGIKLFRV